MKIHPVNDYILVRKHEPEKSDGGIILPDGSRDTVRGCVVADVLEVGPGRTTEDGKLIPCCCKPGDRVLITPQTQGKIVDFGNGKVRVGLTRDHEVMAVLEEDAEPEAAEPLRDPRRAH